MSVQIKSSIVANQLKDTEQNFAEALFNFLYKGIPTFESVYKIPTCDHSNESCRLVFSSVFGCNLFSEKKLTTALEYWFCPSQE